MTPSAFVYTTYIKTTPEKLWHALTNAEFMKQYWFGALIESDWKTGSPWKMSFPDGDVADAGEIVESVPAKRLVIKWRNEWKPEMKAEGYSRCTFEIEPADGALKLTVTHSIDKTGSKLIEAVSGGWPKILSNLKSILETGTIAVEGRMGCKSKTD
ncbi:MAG TPA: SRPBCC family protein [Lacunisphaera sp.]